MSNIDLELSQLILERYNRGEIGRDPKATLKEIPSIDNRIIIDRTKEYKLQIDASCAQAFIKRYNLPESLILKWEKANYTLDNELLKEAGIYLYPYFSYGVLNGGSATSYVDSKKNRGFDEGLFNNYETLFNNLKLEYRGKAKGITPAFINSDGTPGPSFMELKMRKLLLQAKEYFNLTGKRLKNLFPMFQMTSTSNNDEISEYYSMLENSPYLTDLIKETGINITDVKSGIQPLITAYTHSNKGEIKDYFKDSDGNYLGLPGGHGQCFIALKEIFQDLYNEGIRFVSIGNVDNIGYFIDPVSLAILGITDKEASFDFSFKTDFDVKGGVLIRDEKNRLNCADLGVAVSKEDVNKATEKGDPILFNCATGLFNLEFLINNIDHIINNLPTRFSDQSKDRGEYSQAEQVTWEVIALLDDFLIFAINKFDKFLASKLLLENLVTSGLTSESMDKELLSCGRELNRGLKRRLEDLELIETKGRWTTRC